MRSLVCLACRSKFYPSCFRGKRNYIGASVGTEWLHWMIGTEFICFCRLFNAQTGHGRDLSCSGETDAQGAGDGIKLQALKLPGVECEPCTQRSQVDAHTKGIERRDLHDAAVSLEVPSKTQPAELRMINDVSSRVQSMAEKVRTVIPGERIKLQHVRKSVERGRRETFLVDVGDGPHRAAIADTQQVKIFRVLTILG